MDTSLVKVLDAEGQLLGTGWVVTPSGHVLTCHHVVDGHVVLQLEGRGGSRATVGADSVTLVPEHDLALVTSVPELGAPLPVAPISSVPVVGYRTKGFHRLGDAIRAAFPAEGRVTGTTTVRYHTATQEYEIVAALVLRDEEFSPGLSGAPVVDRETGAVVGVVSTMLRSDLGAGGLAVPLSADTAPQPLQAVLAENAENVPVWGRHLNVAGLRAACDEQVRAALDDLALLNRVGLADRVPREGVQTRLDELAERGRAPVVALVGPSGVGKSTEVAALVARRRRPAVLLRASALTGQAVHIGTAVAAALYEATGGQLPEDDGRLMAEAAGRLGGVLVVLDALDKMPVPPAALGEWTTRSLSWLRKASARLVVSSRPEYWELFTPPLLATNPPLVDVVTLGEFTDAEMRAAAQRRGISVGAEAGPLHLPVMLALYADAVRSPGSEAAVPVDDVLEAYTRAAAQRIAAEIGSGASAGTVLDWLAEAARALFEGNADELSPAEFHRIFPDALLAGDRVVSEHLMSQAPRGYRFVYDDVADWLQGRFVQLDAQLTDAGLRDLGRGQGWRRVGPTAYALREQARIGGAEALVQQLDRLVAAVPRVGETAASLLEQTLLKVPDARPYRASLEQFARSQATQLAGRLTATAFWAELALPLEDRLALLRLLVPADTYWGWRQKDWADVPVHEPEWHFAALAHELVAANPERGFPALRDWFDDGTRLAGGESSVAEVALGILFRLRRVRPDLLWHVLGGGSGSRYLLLDSLATDDPELLIDLVARRGADVDPGQTVRAAAMLPLSSLSDELRRDVLEVLRSLLSRPLAPDVRATALDLLARNDDDSEALAALVAQFLAGRPGTSAYTFVGLLPHAPDTVVAALVKVLREDADRRDDVLQATGGLADATATGTIDAALLDLLRSGRVEVSYPVSRYVEDRLWRAPRLDPLLDQLAHQVIAAPPGSGRDVLAYPLTSHKSLVDDGDARARLARDLVTAADDPQTLSRVVDKAAEEPDLALGHDVLIREALDRLPAAEADDALFRSAYLKHSFGPTLYEWLVSGKLTAPGPLVQRFRELVDAGEAPKAAADRVMDEELDRRL